jgi:acetyl-CoA C-acetyltransferase
VTDPRVSDATPVLVGVGQFTERIDAPDYRALPPYELAAEAARRAFADTLPGQGALEALAPHVDLIHSARTFEDTGGIGGVPFGRSNNFPRSVARRLGLRPAHAIWEKSGGDSPQKIVSEVCEKIAAGSARFVLVVGAETISTMRHLQAQKQKPDWSETLDEQVEDRGWGLKGARSRYLLQHGILGAPIGYSLLEQARRGRMGMTREQYAREQMGALFAPFSAIAAANPYSSSAVKAYSAEELITPTASNRMISAPYTRLLVSRDQVNQAAALILTSVGMARQLGIAESQWVYLHGYSEAAERRFIERADLGASPAAHLAAKAALAAAGVTPPEVSYFDFYSCFPIAVSNTACDALGLAPDDSRGLTVTGGLPFFGGPGNNYSMHAIASMAEKLRAKPGSFGFVGANGGTLAKYAAGVYSTRPAEWKNCDSSALQAQIDALPAPDIAYEPEGWATIETYNVVYGRSDPSHAIVVGRLEVGGARFLANSAEADQDGLARMVRDDVLGARVYVRATPKGNRVAFSRDTIDALYPRLAPAWRDAYEHALVDRRGHVLEVTLNRPQSDNRLHPPANFELDAIWEAFEADDDLWVAILAGAGGNFCAGEDLEYAASGQPLAGNHPPHSVSGGFAGLTSRTRRAKPVIAAVSGQALGAGMELCLACDLVVADRHAEFALDQARYGGLAALGGVQRLARMIPRKLASELLLTARNVKAEEMQALGLVNRIAPAGESLAVARVLAAEIAGNSPTSVQSTLQVMNEAAAFGSEHDAMAHQYEAVDDLPTTADYREGMAARVQQRKPQWKNR